MAFSHTYDPNLIKEFEARYLDVVNKEITTRHAFGGVWAYYRTSWGTPTGLRFWENLLETNMSHLHIYEILELTEAFNCNLTLHRNHFRQKLNTLYKPILLKNWDKEVTFNQRIMT